MGGPIFKDTLPLKICPTGSPKTSVTNQPTLRNNPDDGRIQYKVSFLCFFAIWHEISRMRTNVNYLFHYYNTLYLTRTIKFPNGTTISQINVYNLVQILSDHEMQDDSHNYSQNVYRVSR